MEISESVLETKSSKTIVWHHKCSEIWIWSIFDVFQSLKTASMALLELLKFTKTDCTFRSKLKNLPKTFKHEILPYLILPKSSCTRQTFDCPQSSWSSSNSKAWFCKSFHLICFFRNYSFYGKIFITCSLSKAMFAKFAFYVQLVWKSRSI